MRNNQLKSLTIPILLLAFLFLPPSSAAIQQKTERDNGRNPVEACDLYGFVNEPDPAGLNVRSGPGKQYGIVSRLPDGARVRITGAKAGWFYLSYALPMQPGSTERKVDGWVYAQMVTISTRHLGSGPESRVRIYFGPSNEGGGNAWVTAPIVVRLSGCRGGWAKALFPAGHGSSTEGWLAPGSFCANPQMKCK